MEYIKIGKIDPINTCFHFSRIDNRKSIEKYGLQAVPGGENEAANDKNKTIYFSRGFLNILKVVDVWARWEYNRYASQEKSKGHRIKREYKMHKIEGKDESYDKEVMREIIFNKLYEDFKNRQYYTVDLIEGKNGDFEIGDIDVKKIFTRDKDGRPSLEVLWLYGPYSDFGTSEKPNNEQEEWNMNTKSGDRIIPSERLKIIETQDDRTDGLSVIMEVYEKYRKTIPKENDSMYEILDSFVAFAKEKYKSDKDFKEGSMDYGRRDINIDEQKKYQRINQIYLNKSNINPIFSSIVDFLNKIKSVVKRKDIKMLLEGKQTNKVELSNKQKQTIFLENLRVLPEKLVNKVKKQQTERNQNHKDGPSLDE